MLKKLSLIIILFTVMFIASSCFDANEVDYIAYITTIGIDKGIADKWRFSFQVATIESSDKQQTSDGKEKEQYTTLTIDSAAFFQAINVLDTSIARPLNFMHTKYLIISREVAEMSQFAEVMAPIIRFREIRRTTNVIVSSGTAENFIENLQPYIGLSMPRLQVGLISQSEETGFFPKINLNDYYSSLKSTYTQPIAIMGGVNNFSHLPQEDREQGSSQLLLGERHAGKLPRKGGNKVELFGTAIFDGDKMIHELDGFETRVMLMIRGDYKRGIFSHADPLDPDVEVVINLEQRSKPKIKVRFDKGKPIIYVKINLDGDILAIQSRINYETANKIGYLENMIESVIKKEADALIDKAKKLNVDFFGFGYNLAKSFLTIQEWEEYNWLDKFQDAKVIVEVEAKIRRTGTMIKSSPLINMEGKDL